MNGSIRFAIVAAVLGAVMQSTTASAQASFDVVKEAQVQALQAWHEKIKEMGPPTDGCFHATYPSMIWEKEACLPVSKHRVVLPRVAAPSLSARAAESARPVAETVGDGNDYEAQTANLTISAVGSFPSVKGVTSASNGDYTLQLNTNSSASSACNATYGYSSCTTWEQYIYGTTGELVSGTPPQAYIQDWLFLSFSDFYFKGCPSGWESYAAQYACYKDSDAVDTDDVALSDLGSVKLSGSASTSGKDTVIFTHGTVAKSVSQSGKTLSIGSTWKQSEFNVVGNGGGSGLSFNPGSSLTVRIQTNDGSNKSPTCFGPKLSSATAETNNLTLGSCKAVAPSGTSLGYIEFTESN